MDTRATPGTSVNIPAQGERTVERDVLAGGLGKTKSDVVVAVIRVVVVAVRRTHPPRFVVPRTTAKGPARPLVCSPCKK